ncbi:hypothetical protein TNIN_335221 [Trichonephila inaurata madagascariensis]|uniref:Uncharacterized protein n=1 Tax=Trichonephila inaurata madagascariensis TaxID=2747483 RepID=A0A8X6IU23_9ARAC|nr:hypothetical protein TNIN_335221 [Trichonephila inaurata madagascariensis]
MEGQKMIDMVTISSQEVILIAIILIEETTDLTDIQNPMDSALTDLKIGLAILQKDLMWRTEGDYLPQSKADSEDYSAEARHNASPVTDLSPGPRSYIPSNKRKERTNYYDSNRKYMMGKRKGISVTVPIQIPKGEGMGLILTKSTIIKIKMIKMLEDKIMTVK